MAGDSSALSRGPPDVVLGIAVSTAIRFGVAPLGYLTSVDGLAGVVLRLARSNRARCLGPPIRNQMAEMTAPRNEAFSSESTPTLRNDEMYITHKFSREKLASGTLRFSLVTAASGGPDVQTWPDRQDIRSLLGHRRISGRDPHQVESCQLHAGEVQDRLKARGHDRLLRRDVDTPDPEPPRAPSTQTAKQRQPRARRVVARSPSAPIAAAITSMRERSTSSTGKRGGGPGEPRSAAQMVLRIRSGSAACESR